MKHPENVERAHDPGSLMAWRLVSAGAISAIVVGGAVYGWHAYVTGRIKARASRTERAFQQQVDRWQREGTRLYKRIDELQSELAEWQTAPHAFEKKVAADLCKVYGADKEARHEEIHFYVAVPKRLPLLEKLKVLAYRLSSHEFGGHPISVLRIENREDRRIAVIELKELDSPRAFTWRGGYFQGSTGGHFTTLTLTKTFLQEDYEGEWIDGVEFYYEGEPISDDWDHIFLSGTIYRRRRGGD